MSVGVWMATTSVALMLIGCGGAPKSRTTKGPDHDAQDRAALDRCHQMQRAAKPDPIASKECDELVVRLAVKRRATTAGWIQLAWVRHDLAVAYFARGVKNKSLPDRLKATAYAQLAAKTAPSFAQFWRTLGYFSLHLNGGPALELRALGAFQRVLRLEPHDHRSRRMLARIHTRHGDYREAADQLLHLFRRRPLSFTSEQVLELTAALMRADLLAWGAELYAKAHARDPQRHDFAIGHAMLLRAQGFTSEAKAILRSLPPQRHAALVRSLLQHWSKR